MATPPSVQTPVHGAAPQKTAELDDLHDEIDAAFAQTYTDMADVDNHVDGTTNKVFTAAERTKLAGIESGADVTAPANVKSALDNYQSTTWDMLGANDAELVQVDSLGTYRWVAPLHRLRSYLSQLIGVPAKTTPADADLIGISDSEDGNAGKRLSLNNLWINLFKPKADDLYATTAQGALATSAVQPGDIGTAALADTADFATAIQGALADTAVQPGDIGTAALKDEDFFAPETDVAAIRKRGAVIEIENAETDPNAIQARLPSGFSVDDLATGCKVLLDITATNTGPATLEIVDGGDRTCSGRSPSWIPTTTPCAPET